jgi:hypothetical protein
MKEQRTANSVSYVYRHKQDNIVALYIFLKARDKSWLSPAFA